MPGTCLILNSNQFLILKLQVNIHLNREGIIPSVNGQRFDLFKKCS